MKATLLLLITLAAQLAAEEIKTGRIRILSATTTTVVTGGGSVDSHRVFKIDTQTGETWVFNSYVKTNGLMEGWVPLPVMEARDPVLATYDRFLSWADEHRDGAASTNGNPAYTAAEIAKRRAEVQILRDDLVGKNTRKNAP